MERVRVNSSWGIRAFIGEDGYVSQISWVGAVVHMCFSY